jgi:hypothetical protein
LSIEKEAIFNIHYSDLIAEFAARKWRKVDSV